MSKQKSPSWSQIKAELSSLDQKELVDLIRDLYRLNKENKVFLTTHFGLGSSEVLAEPYRRAIRREFNPDRGFPRLNLGAARKALNDFRKANADPRAEIDMMIYYVEQGVACTLLYGDIDEPFYSSLEGIFENAVASLRQIDSPEFEVEFHPRLERIVRDTGGIGWGFHDFLAEVLYSAYPQ